MLIKVRFGNFNNYINANVFALSSSNGVSYLSCFGTEQEIATAVAAIKDNERLSTTVNDRYTMIIRSDVNYFTSKLPSSDFHHLIVYRKDQILNQNTRDETLSLSIFVKKYDDFYLKPALAGNSDISDEIIDKFFDKLNAYAPVYVKKDWIKYILTRANDYITENYYDSRDCRKNENDPQRVNDINVYSLEIPVAELIEIISTGLKEKCIFIRDNNDVTSEVMEGIDGLDTYLNNFVDDLALKIQGSFDPYFNPSNDTYSKSVNDHDDYVAYMDHLKLFPAQKAVVQACCNAFDEEKKNLYIISEMGTGKTNISSAVVMANYGKLYGMTNVVMCPGTLCEKWARTLEAEIPFAEVHIVTNINDVVHLNSRIKDRNRKTNLFLVISKDRMKTNYMLRPAARWKKRAKYYPDDSHNFFEVTDAYVCPDCGQVLFEKKNPPRGRRGRNRGMIHEPFKEDAFTSINTKNRVCMNTVRKYNSITHAWKQVPCNAPLWRPCNKIPDGSFKGDSTEWVKVGNDMGWVEPQHMEKLSREYLDTNTKLPVAVRKKGTALKDTIEGNGTVQMAPRSYCISKYMRKYFKGYIDYAIIDEVHELSGDSTLQGEAMGDIVRTARKSLCLTGTLLNGYAKSIFYMLFRTHPSLMVKEGFSYSKAGEVAFTKAYGVYKHSRYEAMAGYTSGSRKASTIKALPGASPLIYTKFLMNNAVFACIDDMADGLPGYSEIPVPVAMDSTMEEEYIKMSSDMKTAMRRQKNSKVMSQLALMMTAWPDQPYDQPSIIEPDTKEMLYTAPDLPADEITAKDEECLSIIRENIAQGRKVMVYYTYPGRTDVDRRLPQLLNDEGIKTSVLLSKKPNSFRGRMPKWMGVPTADKREEWINAQLDNDCQVLFVNPKLVQTGLDLLAFPTIIFYQTGYNLSDMRQASRRSWRLGQTQDVNVYFLYYAHTVQETILSMMATKLQAALTIEGKFSEEGLQAMSNNEDILTQVAASVAEGVQETLDVNVFNTTEKRTQNSELSDIKNKKYLIDIPREYKYEVKVKKIKTRRKAYDNAVEVNYVNNPSMLFAAI